MKKLTIFLSAIFATLFSFQINIQEAQAQSYTEYYDARCPVSRFPLGNDNANRVSSFTQRYNNVTMASSFTKPNDRSGNTIDAIWFGWRKLGSHQLERRNLGELGQGLISARKIGLGTLTAGTEIKINPSKMAKGTYYFYSILTTRDGENVSRVIEKVIIN